MKYLILMILIALLAIPATAQETQCVTVPEGKKIVLVPWFVPVKELVWKWHPAMLPEEDKPEECGKLGVSPAVCEETE